MKIVHVEPYFQPELGYQTYYLAKTQAESGNEVCVITSDRYVPFRNYSSTVRDVLGPRHRTPGVSFERGLKVIRLPVIWELASVEKLWLYGLRRALIKLKPEIIFVHGLDIEAVRICKLKPFLPNTKIIADCHMVFQASRGGWVKAYYYLHKLFLSKILVKYVDAFVAVSYKTKKFMEVILGISPERITVISLGCDTNLFRRDEDAREKVRLKYGIERNDVVFIYAGKIIPQKGPHLLIDAALSLCKEHNNVKVMLVGGGASDYLSMIKRKVEGSSLRKNFIFVPMVLNSELFRFYSAADVGVWPSQSSMTMFEAMSCSLPVIISDRSEVTERVSAGNGLTYMAGDAKDLAEKMKTMLNPKLRGVMSLRAREFAEKNDWNVISKRFLELVDI